MATLEQARAAKRALREALAGRDEVTGVGLACADEPSVGQGPAEPPRDASTATDPDDWYLLVNVTSSDASARVPSDVDGVVVRVRITGTISAL